MKKITLAVVYVSAIGAIMADDAKPQVTCTPVSYVCEDDQNKSLPLIGGYPGQTVDISPTSSAFLSGAPLCWRKNTVWNCISSLPDPVDTCKGIATYSGCHVDTSRCNLGKGTDGQCCAPSERDDNGRCLTTHNFYTCGDTASNSNAKTVPLESTYTLTTFLDPKTTPQCSSPSDNSTCAPFSTSNTSAGYSCRADKGKSNCSAISQQPQCVVKEQSCTKANPISGRCDEITKYLLCGSGTYNKSNAIALPDSYSLSDLISTSGAGGTGTSCAADPKQCTLTSRSCDPATLTTNANGVVSCGKWIDNYSCNTNKIASNCNDLEINSSCSVESSTCLQKNQDGSCADLQYVYKCKIGDSASTVSCGPGICDTLKGFGGGSICDAPQTNIQDPSVLATLLATLQSLYDTNSSNIFGGIASKCSDVPIIPGDAANCCVAHGSYSSISDIAKNPTKLKINDKDYTATGSPLEYTSAMKDWVNNNIGKMINACSNDEKQTVFMRDNGMCVDLGDYCTEEIPIIGTCIKKKHSYCCYKSKMQWLFAKTFKTAFGTSFGSAENPQCQGFSLKEFKERMTQLGASGRKITFDPNDIKSAFPIDTQSVQSYFQGTTPTVDQNEVKQTMQNRTANKTDTPASATLPKGPNPAQGTNQQPATGCQVDPTLPNCPHKP